MQDPDLLIRIDENVKYLRKGFDEHKVAFVAHVEEDKKIVHEYLRPLWENHQQDIGAKKTRGLGGLLLGFFINAAIATTAAIAAVKGIGK